ncbi:MAG: EAL and HDOD domain-containing protein [Legionella sp.]
MQIKTLLARQGIYTQEGEVYAYELLYRNGDALTANVDNSNASTADAATSSVITQLFANLEMDNVIGDKHAFINFTYNHLLNDVPHLLPRRRIVVEVLETVLIDEALISALQRLKQAGYRIALDDFIYKPELLPLIALADIIKMDVLHLSKKQIAQQLTPLHRLFHGKLLAEKIEDRQQLADCIDLGFTYFQGFYLNKPDLLKGNTLTENKAHLLHLLAELNDVNVLLEKIEQIILQIPRLSYRILRLANSVSLYRGRHIDSLMDAISQLGLTQIRNWVSLLLLASMNDVATDVLERTLIRAKMCELLAKAAELANPHQAYTVGLLSTLDAILNEPMLLLLERISLSDNLNLALLDKKGELGYILQFTIDYEQANVAAIEHSPVAPEVLADCYLQGIAYANTVIDIIKK